VPGITRLLLIAALVLAAGCDECIDSAVKRCACAGGSTGTQTCEEGAFGRCSCEDVPPPPRCGDTFCDLGEERTCSADCGAICGDGVCDFDESPPSCPGDCRPRCGDAICSGPETAEECPEDCRLGCGDGRCEATDGEECPADCNTRCGDSLCDLGEAFCGDDCGFACPDRAAWTIPIVEAPPMTEITGTGIATRDGEVLLGVATPDRLRLLRTRGSALIADDMLDEALGRVPRASLAAAPTTTLIAWRRPDAGTVSFDLRREDGNITGGEPSAGSDVVALWQGSHYFLAWAGEDGMQVSTFDERGDDRRGRPPIPADGPTAPAIAANADRYLVAWTERGGAVPVHLYRLDHSEIVVHPDISRGTGAGRPPAVLWAGTHFIVAWATRSGVQWVSITPDGVVEHQELPLGDGPSTSIALAVTGGHITMVDTVFVGGAPYATAFVRELSVFGTSRLPEVLTCNPGSEEDAVLAYDPSTNTTWVAYRRTIPTRDGAQIAIAPLEP
jgi:hypothetical protein